MAKQKKQDLERIEALIKFCGEHDAEIKRLTAEMADAKAELKALPAGTYRGADNWTVVATIRRTLNKTRAFELYGKKVTERVVTVEAVKAAGVDLDSVYDSGEPALSFKYVG